MFDITKFGRYLAALRKKADMTQMELADRLCVTRQAISKYEQGESFPNVSILVLIAEVFHITLDELIGSGDPTNGEANILKSVAIGESTPIAENICDVVNLAPLLKPSILDKLSARFSQLVASSTARWFREIIRISRAMAPTVTATMVLMATT